MLTAGVHRLRASGCIPGALDLFGVLTVIDPTGAIVVVATSLPIDLNRQNPTGSGCHQQEVALTLGHALKQCGARWLEVDGRELGVLTLPSALGGCRTVLYDDTPGGSGHVLELAEGFARDWLVAARALLVGQNAAEHDSTCQRACLSCLLSFETEPDAPSLDRRRGIGALTALLDGVPPSPTPPGRIAASDAPSATGRDPAARANAARDGLRRRERRG